MYRKTPITIKITGQVSSKPIRVKLESMNSTPKVIRMAAPSKPRALHLGHGQVLFLMYRVMAFPPLALSRDAFVGNPNTQPDQNQRHEHPPDVRNHAKIL